MRRPHPTDGFTGMEVRGDTLTDKENAGLVELDMELNMDSKGQSRPEAAIAKRESPSVLDGYVVKLDLPELKELVSLMRYSSNNLNQLTRKVHETGRVYDADLEDISQRQEQLWDGVQKILAQLSKLS